MITCLIQGGRDAADSLQMLENGPCTEEHETEVLLAFELNTYEWKAFTVVLCTLPVLQNRRSGIAAHLVHISIVPKYLTSMSIILYFRKHVVLRTLSVLQNRRSGS